MRLTTRSHRSKTGGFTMIEMLVIIAIIAILAAILLPVLMTARRKSYQANCASNLKQIYMAFKSYESDYDGDYPPWHNFVASTTQTPDLNPPALVNALNKYMGGTVAGNADLWFCKSDSFRGQSVVWSGVDQRYTGYLIPKLRWHHRLKTIAGQPPPPDTEIPMAGDPTGAQWDMDSPGLQYRAGLDQFAHFQGTMVLWADGHAKWQTGAPRWQAIYP